ncbi:MAG: DUF648 domain-containing protein [Parachlamydia sp.]|nr:DUF648 domain-containing protein [Parachlamydia sp.]
MSTKIGFFTPVSFSGVGPKNSRQRLFEAVDTYFYLGKRKAYVIDKQAFDGKILVDERKEQIPTTRVAMKVASYVLLFPFAIAVLAIKLAIRLAHSYNVVKPEELLAKIERMRESNVPEQKLALKERKKHLLATAYMICVRNIEHKEMYETPKREQAFILGEILTQFATLTYADEKIPNSFEVSKQILFGALSAQLKAAGVIEKCFNFTLPATKNLRKLPGSILDTRPFKSMENTFIGLDQDALYQKIVDSKLTEHQRIVLCQTLRYINGAQRHIVDKKGAPNASDCDFFTKLLNLAEKVVLIDAAQEDAKKSKAVLNELWELRYNDFPYFYNKVTNEPVNLQRNWDWLYDTARLMPENYLRNISRIANKSARTVDEYKNALKLLKTALLHYLDDDTNAKLENILERNKHDRALIRSVAAKLVKLDPKACSLNIAWFAIVPNNLADAMMRANPRDLQATKGLLYLAKEIVDLHEQQKVEHYNFSSIKHNYYLLHLLNAADTMKTIAEQELPKVERVVREANLADIDMERLSVSVIHLKKCLNSISKSFDWMSDVKKYQENIKARDKLQKDLDQKLDRLRRMCEAIRKNPDSQQEAREEARETEDLVKRSRTFARDLFNKADPQQVQP